MSTKYIKINPDDNVAVAILDLAAGEKVTIDGTEITLVDAIPAGHKFALTAFATNDNIVKYGYPIGHAIVDIPQGGVVNEKKHQNKLRWSS